MRRARGGSLLAAVALAAGSLAGAAADAESAPSSTTRRAAPALNECWSSDNGDPVLDSISFSPRTLDVRRAARTVAISADLHDTGGPGAATDIEGVRVVWGGDVDPVATATLRDGADGVYRGSVRVPRNARPAQWRDPWVEITDGAGHLVRIADPGLSLRARRVAAPRVARTSMQLIAGDPRRLAISTSLTQPGTEITRVRAHVGRVGATETRSGRLGRVVRLHPDGAGRYTGSLALGEVTAGPARRTLSVLRLDVRSAATGEITLAGSQLGRRTAREVSVRSRTDHHAPRAGAVTITPSTIEVTDGSQVVSLDVDLTDRGSGIDPARVALRPQIASEGDSPYTSIGWLPLTLTQGTVRDGRWHAEFTLSPCDVQGPGTLTVQSTIRDRAGNEVDAVVLPRRAEVIGGDHRRPEVRRGPRPQAPSDALTLRFDEPVTGIDAESVIAYPMSAGVPGPRVAGVLTCLDGDGASVDCLSGPVRRARFQPSDALDERYVYLEVNPEHRLGVLDQAGNPVAPRSVVEFGYPR